MGEVPPRRILMTTDTLGGVWQYSLELCRELTRRGHEIALASLGRLPDRAQRSQVRSLRGVQFHPSALRLVWMDEPWSDVEAAGEWLLELERRLQPDLVHLNDLGHGHLPWQAPVLMVAHSCVLSWWRAVHGEPAPASWSRYAAHVRRSLRAADLVVAPTHAMLAELLQCHGPLPATRVIPNGRRPPHAAAVRREPMVLAAGRAWDAAKNIGALAAAASGLAWPVRVAGCGRSPDGCEASLPGVGWLGQLDAAALDQLYRRAPIYALPARYEPFGLSVLEAAQAGCALLLGDIASLRENWDGAALFVHPDHPAELTEALRRMIEDEALRARLAGESRRRASAFTAAAMAQGYEDAYRSLCTLGAPHACRAGSE